MAEKFRGSKLQRAVHIAWSLGKPNGLATGTYQFIDSYSGFSTFFDRDKGERHPKELVDALNEWIYYPQNSYPNGLIMKTPGKYTGEMRKVIQALISTGQYIYYDYLYNYCHGVYTTADGTKWVIEISDQGVFAALMPLSVAYEDDLSWLGYAPSGIQDAFDEWEGYRQLLDASDLAEFYSKNILFNACGWAFNLKGSIAVNTCYEGGSGGPYGNPATSYLYQIYFTEGDEQYVDAEGLIQTRQAPVSASMMLVSSGQYALPKENGIKHPNNTEDSLILDTTGYQNGQEVLSTFTSPRYAFFDGDTLKVVRSIGQTGAMTVTDGKVVDSLPTPHIVKNALYGGISPCGYPDEQETILQKVDDMGTYYVELSGGAVDQTGTVVDGYNLTPKFSGKTIRCEFSLNEYQWESISYGTPLGFPVGYVTNHSKIHSDGVNSVSCGVVPLGDRESVYQLQDVVYGSSCEAIVRMQLTGNGTIQRTNCDPVSPYKSIDTIVSPFTGTYYEKNPNRYKDHLPTGTCEANSNTDNPPEPGVGYFIIQHDNIIPSKRSTTLNLISSGNVETVIFSTEKDATPDELLSVTSAYNTENDPVDNPQWMYVHRDNTKDLTMFCSAKMNAVLGSDQYIVGIDQSKYDILNPSGSLTGNCFWVGDPHCVNNDCT